MIRERLEVLTGRRSVMSLGVLASAAALGGGLYASYDSPQAGVGAYSSYPPSQTCEPLVGDPNVATFNSAGVDKVKDIKHLVVSRKISALALQELRPQDVAKLHTANPCYSLTYVLASMKDDGKGNAWLVRGPVDSIVSQSLTDKSRSKMAVDVSLKATKNNLVAALSPKSLGILKYTAPMLNNKSPTLGTTTIEQRAALAVTTQARIGDETVSLQLVTGHIGRQRAVVDDQLHRELKFVKRQTQKNPNTVFCGDTNTQPSKMLSNKGEFAKIHFAAIKTKPTLAKGTSRVDYCAQNTDNTDIYLTGTHSDPIIKSDHITVITTVTPKFDLVEVLVEGAQAISQSVYRLISSTINLR